MDLRILARRWSRRILLWGILFSLAWVSLNVYLDKVFLPSAGREHVIKFIQEGSPFPLACGDVQWLSERRIQIKDIRFYDTDQQDLLMQAAVISLQIHPAITWSGLRWVMSDVRIVQPVVHLRRREDMSPPPSARMLAEWFDRYRIWISDVRIEDGIFVIRDDASGGAAHRLHHVDLDLHLNRRRGVEFHLSMMGPDDLPMEMESEGQLSWWPPYPFSATAMIRKVPLPLLASLSTSSIPIQVRSGQAQVTLAIRGTQSKQRVQADIQAQGVEAAAKGISASGDLSCRLHAAYEPASDTLTVLSAALQPSNVQVDLTGTGQRLESVYGKILMRPPGWEISELEGVWRMAPWKIHGSLSRMADDGRLVLEGQIRLGLASLEPWWKFGPLRAWALSLSGNIDLRLRIDDTVKACRAAWLNRSVEWTSVLHWPIHLTGQIRDLSVRDNDQKNWLDQASGDFRFRSGRLSLNRLQGRFLERWPADLSMEMTAGLPALLQSRVQIGTLESNTRWELAPDTWTCQEGWIRLDPLSIQTAGTVLDFPQRRISVRASAEGPLDHWLRLLPDLPSAWQSKLPTGALRVSTAAVWPWDTAAPPSGDMQFDIQSFGWPPWQADRIQGWGQFHPERIEFPKITWEAYDGHGQAHVWLWRHPGSRDEARFEMAAEDLDMERLPRNPKRAKRPPPKGRMSVSGWAAGPLDAAKQWTGEFDMEIRRGYLGEVPFVKGLAELFRFADPQQLIFTQADGHFRLEEGLLKTDDLVIQSQDVVIQSRGTSRLNGELDLDAVVRLAPEVAQQPNGGGFMQMVGALWRYMRVKIRGPADDPKFTVVPFVMDESFQAMTLPKWDDPGRPRSMPPVASLASDG